MKTEYEFILPRGYVDANGDVHREGVMRLANAKMKSCLLTICVFKEQSLLDHRIAQQSHHLGTVEVNTGVIENMFASDSVFLERCTPINEDEATIR